MRGHEHHGDVLSGGIREAMPAPAAQPSPGLAAIVCTHARPAYAAACIEGLRAQLRPPAEILLVDSASPPVAARALEALAAAQDVTLIRVEEPGLSRARNAGLAAARAGWIAYLDDDSVPEPDWAERLEHAIARLPAEAAVLGGSILPHWEAPLPAWWPETLRGVLTIVEWPGSGEAGRDIPADVCVYGANMAFRADALRALGGFPEGLGRVGTNLLSGEEVEVIERLGAAGHRVFYDGSAAVRHCIQRDRLRPDWLLSRLHWQGKTDALRQGRRRRRRPLGRMCGALGKLALQAPLLLWPSRSAVLVRMRCGAQYNLGYLRGLLSGT